MAEYLAGMDTVLLVDVQDYWADKNPATTQRIKDSVETFRQKGMQIVWVYAQENPDEARSFSAIPPQQVKDREIKHVFNGHGRFLFDPAIPPAPGDWVVAKGPNQTDAFTNPHLAGFLKGQDNVYVAGFMAGFCAHDTAASAKQAGFRTTLLSDLSADNRDRLDADGQDFRKQGGEIKRAADLFTRQLS